MDRKLVTKSEFAALINVSAGRISQFIAQGKISQAAIVGIGQRAKIDVELAKSDLRLTLDVSQRIGNGHETRLEPEPSHPRAPGGTTEAVRGIDHEIKAAKLDQILRVNRANAIDEAKKKGLLAETAGMRAQMTKLAATMLTLFEGSLSELETAVAATFNLPQRDIRHIIRKQYRAFRERASQQMASHAVLLPEHVEITIEGANEVRDLQ